MSLWASWLPSLKGFDTENVGEGRKRQNNPNIVVF